jgi:hypothetical protein
MQNQPQRTPSAIIKCRSGFRGGKGADGGHARGDSAALAGTGPAGDSPGALAGFGGGVSIALRHVEIMTPEWELWTTLPDEAELTSQSRIGDHLAVTRRLLGIPV